MHSATFGERGNTALNSSAVDILSAACGSRGNLAVRQAYRAREPIIQECDDPYQQRGPRRLGTQTSTLLESLRHAV